MLVKSRSFASAIGPFFFLFAILALLWTRYDPLDDVNVAQERRIPEPVIDPVPEVSLPPTPQPIPSTPCRVGLWSLEIPGIVSRDCRKELWERHGMNGKSNIYEQHRFLHHLKHSVGEETLFRLDKLPAGRSDDVDAILLDDENYSACYLSDVIGASRRNVTKIVDDYVKRRRQEVRGMLDKTKLPMIVIEDHPYYRLAPFRHAQAFFMVQEASQLTPKTGGGDVDQNYLIIPYTSPANPHLKPAESWDKDEFFIHFIAACSGNLLGKRMRAKVVESLSSAVSSTNSQRLRLQCSVPGVQQTVPYSQLVKELASSRFCPVAAGDTPSSRRISDVIAAGCIPVLIGPPFPAVPYLPFLNYSDFALVFKIKEATWMDAQDAVHVWTTDPLAEQTLFGDHSSHLRVVNTPSDIYTALEAIPGPEILRLKQGVRKVVSWFVAGPESSADPRPQPSGEDDKYNDGKVYSGKAALAAACSIMEKRGLITR